MSGTSERKENAGLSAGAGVRRADSPAPTILVVDNYDSFVYNLVQYVGEVVVRMGGDGDDVLVRRNDVIDTDDVRDLDPDGIVLSPGPGTPEASGISMGIVSELAYPTLGVCLGHQALCAANGVPITHADTVVHGKSSSVTHDGTGVFAGLPNPIDCGRYHSLTVESEKLPAHVEMSAHITNDPAALMAVRHRERPHVGVQFHPESILTAHGNRLIENFCHQCTTT